METTLTDLGYGESEVEQRRFNFVNNKAMKLIVAAGLEGEAAESVRVAVHSNYAPVVERFRHTSVQES